MATVTQQLLDKLEEHVQRRIGDLSKFEVPKPDQTRIVFDYSFDKNGYAGIYRYVEPYDPKKLTSAAVQKIKDSNEIKKILRENIDKLLDGAVKHENMFSNVLTTYLNTQNGESIFFLLNSSTKEICSFIVVNEQEQDGVKKYYFKKCYTLHEYAGHKFGAMFILFARKVLGDNIAREHKTVIPKYSRLMETYFKLGIHLETFLNTPMDYQVSRHGEIEYHVNPTTVLRTAANQFVFGLRL